MTKLKSTFVQSTVQSMITYRFVPALLLFLISTPLLAQFGDSENIADDRVRVLLEELEFDYEVDGDGDFRLVFELEDERSQIVYVVSNTNDYEHLEIREVWSPGYVTDGDLDGDIAVHLLKDSRSSKLGAWELIQTDESSVAIFTVKISATSDAQTLAAAISAALLSADKMELELLGTDEL